MKLCAQCAHEIPESVTICDWCRRAALDRLLDGASLNTRTVPVAPPAVEYVAPPAPGGDDAPDDPDQDDVFRGPVVERFAPPADDIRPVSDPDDVRLPNIDEIWQLPMPDEASPPPLHIEGPELTDGAATDDWPFAVSNAVRREPAVPTVPGRPTAPGVPATSRPPDERSASVPQTVRFEPETHAAVPPTIADGVRPSAAGEHEPEVTASEQPRTPYPTEIVPAAATDTVLTHAPTDTVAVSESFGGPAQPPPSAMTAPKPAGGLGMREVAVIAISLIFGGTATFAMLRASGNRQPTAVPVESGTSKGASKSTAPAVGHTWMSANREWVGNDRHAAAFEVRSNNKVPVWLRQAQPILVVRCVSRRTEAFVFIESAAQIEAQQNHGVRVRFDDEPETEERWPDSDDHDALFAPDGAAFTQRLLGAHTLHFGYTPHNSPKVVAEFNVSGLGRLMEPVAKGCGSKK